jgi:CheY-like chemotaxis protein
VEACLSGRFDVALMDVEMPELNGLDATREIRRREADAGWARLPIIALTARA